MNSYRIILVVCLPLFFTGCLGHLGHRSLSHREYGYGDYGAVHANYYEPDCDSCSSAGMGSDCATGNCDRCEGGTRISVGAYQGMPLSERLKHRLACGDGCGEVYIGEWISTPPTPDPCDYDGNYTGADNGMMYHPHAQPVRTTLRKIAGIRFLGTRYAHDSSIYYADDYSSDFAVSSPMAAPNFIPHASSRPSCNCGH